MLAAKTDLRNCIRAGVFNYIASRLLEYLVSYCVGPVDEAKSCVEQADS